MLLIPEVAFPEKRPVTKPMPRVIRKGASSIRIRAVGSRKISLRSLRAMMNNFCIECLSVAQGAPGQVQKDRFEVWFADVH